MRSDDGRAAGKSGLRTSDDDGVTFKVTHLDGSRHRFTPEVHAGPVYWGLIIFAFDECTTLFNNHGYLGGLRGTDGWAGVTLSEHGKLRSRHPGALRQFLYQGLSRAHSTRSAARRAAAGPGRFGRVPASGAPSRRRNWGG